MQAVSWLFSLTDNFVDLCCFKIETKKGLFFALRFWSTTFVRFLRRKFYINFLMTISTQWLENCTVLYLSVQYITLQYFIINMFLLFNSNSSSNIELLAYLLFLLSGPKCLCNILFELCQKLYFIQIGFLRCLFFFYYNLVLWE